MFHQGNRNGNDDLGILIWKSGQEIERAIRAVKGKQVIEMVPIYVIRRIRKRVEKR